MITKIQYSTLDESIQDASEVYFWENAIKISTKFIEGFMNYESEWIHKRRKPLANTPHDPSTMIFGTSVLKNKPVVLANRK